MKHKPVKFAKQRGFSAYIHISLLAHLKTVSILVFAGDIVKRGKKLAHLMILTRRRRVSLFILRTLPKDNRWEIQPVKIRRNFSMIREVATGYDK